MENNQFTVEAGEPESNTNRRRRLRKYGAVALSSLAVVGTGLEAGKITWDHFDRSGKVYKYSAIEPDTIPGDNRQEELALIDGQLKVASWNMHNETARRHSQIKNFARENEVDVIALQEVSKDDAAQLTNIKGWYVVFVIADAKFREGGLGNVIMTRQKPQGINSKTLRGNGYLKTIGGWSTGLLEDTAHAAVSVKGSEVKFSSDNIRSSWREDRAALALTVQTSIGGKEVDARFITSHISGPNVGDNPAIYEDQRKQLRAFIKTNLKESRPTVFCGDLNGRPEEIVPWFEEMGFSVLTTGRTSTNIRYPVDYCAYNHTGLESSVVKGEITVLENPKTDHHPLVATLEILPIQGLSSTYHH